MCGVAGILTSNAYRKEELVCAVQRAADPLSHRGSDDSGVWVDPKAGVALGFRRLAIIDLSEHGHQPMHSASGRYTIVFNDEVSKAAVTKRFVGMFAMGVWDAQTRRLSLMRDRLGIKPLFVFARPGVIAFGSELKSLAAQALWCVLLQQWRQRWIC